MHAFVVEDDPDFRELVRDVLERAGWSVDAAEDGFAALSQIRRVIPDLILLDLRIPNLDGAGVLSLLRSTEVGRRIPVLVMTGGGVDDEVRDLASEVLVKPFARADLLRAVQRLTAQQPPAR
ncbi:MAG TPA: response regulator [Anaeromyxobacteraceae bacterium]|jgi:DNA-binding response OmpR family regulator|nr:response regulator [Anaeromyxobacteraceae bacterium]